jgi:hypothetical protein
VLKRDQFFLISASLVEEIMQFNQLNGPAIHLPLCSVITFICVIRQCAVSVVG